MRKQGDVRAWVRNNAVTVMFVLLCIICIIYSGQSMSYVIYEMFGRLSRNAFIVLALIIPIVAGMGINFASPSVPWRRRSRFCGFWSGRFPASAASW